MVVVKEYNKIADGYSTNANESYRIVRDNIKRYWKEHNGIVVSTKKERTKDHVYCRYIVKIMYD